MKLCTVPGILLALASLAGTASATTIYWNTNGPDTQWTNPANWIGGHVPGINDLAVITPGAGPLIVTTATIGGLYVQPGGVVVIVGQLYVFGGASIQGNMSIAGSSGRFYHRDSVNLEGTLTMWSGASIIRHVNGNGNSLFTVQPSGRIVVPPYCDTAGVFIDTYIELLGTFDQQSSEQLRMGRFDSDWGYGCYITVHPTGTLLFEHACSISASSDPGQGTPAIYNNGLIQAQGVSSDTVTVGAGVGFENSSSLIVTRSDFRVQRSWDVDPDGLLLRGNWETHGVGRILFDNTVVNTIGPDSYVQLFEPGSQFMPLQGARENRGYISLNFATAYLNPAGGNFTNHGTIYISDHSTIGFADQFTNAADGSLGCQVSGSDFNSYGNMYGPRASLAGTLNAFFETGYRPASGDTQQIIQAGQSLSGHFDTVSIYSTPVPIDALYDAKVAKLVAGCAADFNHDGAVDFFDYDDFVRCFEGGACPSAWGADFNGDYATDFFDYDEFVVAFESGC